ncbi:cell division protein FtsZ [Croceicoccus marinus]|uniref:Cell division protein FtsZ n=1 Tax=Croceicoccus marinus TaxID=450378 RepID=A0A7G6VX45_9SPHN|nr:cell division protein FtsZ [Croceicoccus marinus]QNE06310.1 cell division protein FtsZ [Croceicoccus marinus]
MSINIGPPAVEELRPRITVIGVGGAGGNAIANMIQAQIEGVDFIVANTDAQALNTAVCEDRIQLGPEITQGLGAGSRPEVGRAAAEETLHEIDRMLDGVHMCFIAAGMGGGTGTGAAPVIAKAAREKGVLTVGVVTKPFMFEGTRRMRSADAGIEELQKHVDTLIVIPNQNLFLVARPDTTFKEAFQLADEVLQQGVRSITDLMVMPGLINLDFADVRSVMGEMGKAMMGTGEADGENRALEAAEKAIANPLLDGVSMTGAKGVIISIIGGEDMRLMEVDEAANHIRDLVDPDANIIWGSAFNPELEGKIRVSVVATGIDQDAEQPSAQSRPFSLGSGRAPMRPGAAPAAPAPATAPARAAEPAMKLADPADDRTQRHLGDEGGFASAGSEEPLDLGLDMAEAEDEDDGELLLGDGFEEEPRPAAAEPARAESRDNARDSGPMDAPSRTESSRGWRPASGQAAVSVGGSTLFERMANLSRNREDAPADDREDDDATDLNIPRFLGRNNNRR